MYIFFLNIIYKKMFIYIIIFILFYVISSVYFNTWQEQFSVVGYNSQNLKNDTTIDNIFNLKTKNIQTQLLNASIYKDISVKSYILYNNNLDFPLAKLFINLIQDFLRINLTNDKIQISTPTNIYFKNNYYIFNVTIINSASFTSRNLIVKIIEKTTSKLSQKYSILHISLSDNNNLDKFLIEGIDYSDLNQYRIKNNLFLLDPFYTSSYDMIITEKMKSDFDNNLQKKRKLQLINISQ